MPHLLTRSHARRPDICCSLPPLLKPSHRSLLCHPHKLRPIHPSISTTQSRSSPQALSHGHHRVDAPQVLLRRRAAPLRPARAVLRRRGHPSLLRRHLRLHLLLLPLHPSLRPHLLPLQPHQGVHRLPRDDPPLHDRHDHPRRHRRGHRRRGIRWPLLRLRALQGPFHQHCHRRAIRLPRRRRVARRAALLRHGCPEAGAPVPRRARHRLRRGRGLRGDQARGALHLHGDEPAPGQAQREALQRRGRGGPDREAGPRRRGGHQLGARVDEPRHAVVHGPQRDGGQGGGQLLRPRRAVRGHGCQEAAGHRHDQRRARDEGARHEHRRGRDRQAHPRGRARHDRHRHGGRRDRRRPENGPDVRGHDDLWAEGGAPGAEGAGKAQRNRRDYPDGAAGVARGVRDRVQGRRGRGRVSRGCAGWSAILGGFPRLLLDLSFCGMNEFSFSLASVVFIALPCHATVCSVSWGHRSVGPFWQYE